MPLVFGNAPGMKRRECFELVPSFVIHPECSRIARSVRECTRVFRMKRMSFNEDSHLLGDLRVIRGHQPCSGWAGQLP